MKKLLYLFAVVFGLAAFVSCEDEIDGTVEFVDWQQRNETYFRDTLALANREIAAAKAQWGEAWEQHCDWRVFPSYCVTQGGKITWEDSIAAHVIEHGTGSGCPLYTDSVRVTYAGRLIPSTTYPVTGYLFDHSGIGSKVEDVMDFRFEVPASFKVSNLVEGFTTALMHMHIGDYWRVFIPANLGYGTAGTDNIPGYSNLIFDMRLKAFYRAGSKPDPWKSPAQQQ